MTSPSCRIIGVSLDELDAESFRTLTRAALDEFSTRKVTPQDWEAFTASLDYVASSAPAHAESSEKWLLVGKVALFITRVATRKPRRGVLQLAVPDALFWGNNSVSAVGMSNT